MCTTHIHIRDFMVHFSIYSHFSTYMNVAIIRTHIHTYLHTYIYVWNLKWCCNSDIRLATKIYYKHELCTLLYTLLMQECKGRRTSSQFDRCSHARMHEEIYNLTWACTYVIIPTIIFIYSAYAYVQRDLPSLLAATNTCLSVNILERITNIFQFLGEL